jgi:hypothetical protein
MNCGCADCPIVDTGNPDIPPIGSTGDNCESLNNLLFDTIDYEFSQYGGSKKIKKYWLASSSVNRDGYASNTHHGVSSIPWTFPDTFDQFTQGEFLLRRIPGDDVAEDYSKWIYSTVVP